MKIWLAHIGECYPFQEGAALMRNGLLANMLVSRGHSVVWWGSNFYHSEKIVLSKSYKEVQINPNYQINLLKGCPYKKNVSLHRLLHHKLVTDSFKLKANKADKPDLIVVSIPLHGIAFEAVKMAQKENIPILIDVRDPWPDDILDRFPKKLRSLGRLLL